MPKKDIKQINEIAKEFKMNSLQRKEFGYFLEEEKQLRYGGTKNERGDFTYQELKEKAKEFLGIN
jgi:transcriptional antiterminator